VLGGRYLLHLLADVLVFEVEAHHFVSVADDDLQPEVLRVRCRVVGETPEP
jgi:hypothetical protein